MNETNSKKLLTFFLMFLCSGAIVYPEFSYAAVTLPWSTSFNCDEWNKPQGSVKCDSLIDYSANTACVDSSGTHYTQITTAAERNSTGGNRGARFWTLPAGLAGNPPGSSSFYITWSGGVSELWISWYKRDEKGLAYSSFINDKMVYINATLASAVSIAWGGNGVIELWAVGGDGAAHYGTKSWYQVMGGQTGDGLWHFFKAHVKLDTDGTNGLGEMWIDGEKVLYYNNLNLGGASNPNKWTLLTLRQNQQYPNNPRCMAQDWDDVKVSTTDPGGPLPDTNIPLPPVPY